MVSLYFSYMNLVLIVQLLWSLCLACQDIFSLRNNRDLHAPDFLLFFVIIDWVMVILMFSGFRASASVTIFFMKDMNFCAEYRRLDCSQFTLSVTLAFFTWLLQAASSFSGFWLLISFF
ncbi:hypothetical protein VPH35_047369 [Triticum aestivum]